MSQLSEAQKKEIVQRLESKGAKRPCPRCNNSQFTLMDGYVVHPVQSSIDSLTIGGRNVPAIVVFCTQCGYMAQHALGALGLLPVRKEGKDDQ